MAGFLIAVITGGLVSRFPGWPLQNLRAQNVLPGVDAAPDARGREQQAALIDLDLSVRAGLPEWAEAYRRARALVDLWNALGNAFSAVLISVVSIGVVMLYRVIHWDAVRWDGLLLFTMLISGALLMEFAISQRRVARITEDYLRGFVVRAPAA